MYNIKFDKTKYLRIINDLQGWFSGIHLIINKDGIDIKDITESSKDLLIKMHIDKEDLGDFEFNGDEEEKVFLPFDEFNKAVRSLEMPIDFEEHSDDKVSMKSGNASFKIKKEDVRQDLYDLYDHINDNVKKDGREIFKLDVDILNEFMNVLSFSAELDLDIKKDSLIIKGRQGYLEGNYECDIENDENVEWKGILSTNHVILLRTLNPVDEIKIGFIKELGEDEVDTIIVNMNIGENSTAMVAFAPLEEEVTSPGEDVEEEDDEDIEEIDEDEIDQILEEEDL